MQNSKKRLQKKMQMKPTERRKNANEPRETAVWNHTFEVDFVLLDRQGTGRRASQEGENKMGLEL